jgi:N-acetyltransferase 10
MLRTLESETAADASWLGAYAKDFHRRFLNLLGFQFRSFGAVQALAIDESARIGVSLLPSAEQSRALTSKDELDALFSPWDLKRLDSYADNMLDWHVILDLMPRIAELYFSGRIRDGNGVKLSGVQQALLCAVGLQRKGLETVGEELGVQMSQVLAMFVKVVRKISSHFRALQEGAIREGMPKMVNGDDAEREVRREDVGKDMDAELEQGGVEFDQEAEERERARERNGAPPLESYAAANGGAEDGPDGGMDWQDAERQVRDAERKGKINMTVSVKSKRPADGDRGKRKAGEALAEVEREAEKLAGGGKGKKVKKGR